MIGLLPNGVAEFLLLLLILGALFVVIRSVRRRRAFAARAASTAAGDLPNLTTQQRVTALVRRTFRDPAQGVWLVEAIVGSPQQAQRLTFCATDYEQAAERWQALTGKKADVALYGLATLAPGGVETMREQIKNAEKAKLHPDMVTLVHEGQFANDYVVIGRALDAREAAWGDDLPLTVYRTEVVRTDKLLLITDLAVPRDPASPSPAFPPQSLVHGSARLFGYLAS